MRVELERRLVDEYPLLYADYGKGPRETMMCFGFDHGDGWFHIVRQLSEDLERLIKELPAQERSNYRASQVKEKFGTLRFYMTSSTEKMEDLIDRAAVISSQTCEICGAPGSLRGVAWLMTRCDEHLTTD